MAQPPASKPKVVDVHTHMYPPEYIQILESRSTIPLVRSFPGATDPRLILLDAEVPALDAALSSGPDPPSVLPGRPLTRHFASVSQKLHFMDTHGIDISIVSLANPWLDFLPPATAGPVATSINTSFSTMCATHPGRLYFFAALPLTAPRETILAAIAHAAALPHCRGVILGTSGLGAGLDDPLLLPILASLAAASLPIFLHPHYGLPNAVFGPRAAGEYGHVLSLAIGFPVETTIAVARMYLAGVFDAVPALRMLLAHSGGCLPFLAGRIESCIIHDGHLAAQGKTASPPRRTVWEVLREQVYLDAVIYSEVGLKAAVQAAGEDGAGRVMFGTDHPFFPPVGGGEGKEDGVWESVGLNSLAVERAFGAGTSGAKGVMGGNAVEVFRLFGE
ncbi:2-amino-3-carboxymuconate-6-semialdehyde decarboxylase [Lasiosphaeria hispida]|uniref:2-amino-3-carboxymuconate-6-semialdehyde decarboxylase n=1 Tax=Lasiosphaeria hispida TaxID=260671 RepID=A0AAJ0HM72_9PEZI|nr:2-amino-3-carboxymuconate-6-semialdehyde decarboxylase [Lasiosphaeria hispida]